MRLMPCNRPYGIVWSYPDLGKEEVSAMILSQLAPYISGYFPSITPDSLFLGEDAVDNNSSSVRRKGDTMDALFFVRNDLYIGSIKKNLVTRLLDKCFHCNFIGHGRFLQK